MVFILYKLYVLLPYTYPTPELSPHRRLCISTFPQITHSVGFISVLKSGDMGQCPHKSPSPCNTCHTCVNIQIYVLICHKTTHTYTHTYTHIHTHIHTYIHTYIYIYIRGGTLHRCHGSVRTSVRGSRFDTISVQHEKKRNLLCSVSFHLFEQTVVQIKRKSI